MAHQSPMISIPKKTTDEVDWTTPIRSLIAQSYGENPENYAVECQALQRCRQDAVKGAGSDMTARDLLYKYFGQLELLELRFSEIRVNFPWHDAFTQKLTTQTSIAFEKASVLYQIAATHSAIAVAQNRSDPDGLKRSFYYFRTCAGMLTYINENFLHAPSTDLSREVVKFLVGIILAQATEVFFEKCTEEKKGNALVAKVGAQAAMMYTTLGEEVKEFMGKGIFDRNWVILIQIKAKYFSSLSQYYRGLADSSSGKHGDALQRFNFAETLAKEASRTAASFASGFVSTISPNIPSDGGTAIHERTKVHLALCTDKKAEAQRENDLIYNALLPSVEALPAIDKAVVATPIAIQEVYGAPDVQKVIGPDLFIKLIPLSVHESASVYSEEKAKLVRAEVEKAEGAEGEVKSAIDAMGVKDGLSRFRAMAEGEVGDGEEVPVEVRRWKTDISVMEDRESVENIFKELNRLKENVHRELDSVSRELEVESKECEMMRVKYEMWSQEPSAALTKSLRQDLKAHFGALEAAGSSDQQVMSLWGSAQGDVKVLLSDELGSVFRASTERGGESLLDLDVGSETSDEQERASIGLLVKEIDDRLGKLNKISRERGEVLKDLKEKVQNDDVSHILLLNRRNQGVEPALFAAELEKFRPLQLRLTQTFHHQQGTIQEIGTLWKTLKDLAGRGPGAKKWEDRERRKKDTIKRFSRVRDVYMEVRDGLAKGLQFYAELTELGSTLKRSAKSFVSTRTVERESMVSKLETQKRLSNVKSLPPPIADKPRLPPPPPSASALSSSLASMSLSGLPTPSPGSRWTPTRQDSVPSQYSSPPQLPPPPSHFNTPQPPSQYGSPQIGSVASHYTGNSRQPSSSSSYGQPPITQSRLPTSQYNSSPPVNQFSPSPASQLPPPPPPPAPQYNYTTPAMDPYASLGMLGVSSPLSNPPPPPPAPAPPQQYQSQHYQQYSQPQRQASYPPAAPPQQQPSYQYSQQPQSQPHSSSAYSPQPPQPTHSAFPPPSQPIQYQQQQPPQHYPPYQPSQGQYPSQYGR